MNIVSVLSEQKLPRIFILFAVLPLFALAACADLAELDSGVAAGAALGSGNQEDPPPQDTDPEVEPIEPVQELPPPEIPIPAPAGRMAFVSERDGNEEIYIMNPDTSNLLRLTSNQASDRVPAWSFDSNRIAFVSNRDGNDEIYVMGANGSNQIRLTSNPAKDWAPAWSADGSSLAFESFRDGNWELYVVRPNDGSLTRLTNNQAGDNQPVWSPVDPRRMAFVSGRDGNGDIYAINSDGGGLTRLTSDVAPDSNPSWSPDGRRIAFTSWRGGNANLFIMNADGSNQIQITSSQADENFVVWSPNGQHLVYRTMRDANWELYALDVEVCLSSPATCESAAVRLTNNSADDFAPVWSSEGWHIAFNSDRDGNVEIYLVDVTGNNLARLSFDAPAYDGDIAWSH